MTQPVRIKLSRAADWNLQQVSAAINGLPACSCARPHLMGNPFGWQTPQLSGHSGRRWAVDRHRAWLEKGTIPRSEKARGAELLELRKKVLAAMPQIRDHNLACFCGLDQACHVDTLLEFANR